MRKFILVFIFCFSLILCEKSALADIYNFVHPDWKEKIEVKNSRFKTSSGQKGKFVKLNKETVILVWDNFSAEIFIYDRYMGAWSFLRRDAAYKIQSEYEEMVYSLDEPYVKLNPFNKTPLSALLKFPTKNPSKITLRIKGKKGHPDIVHTFDKYKTEHEIAVLGLYSNHKNEVVITATNEKGYSKSSKITIKTTEVDVDEQWIPVKKNDKSFNYYATYDGIVYDEYGNLRYQFAESGWRLIYFYKDNVFIETSHAVKRYSLLGELLQEYKYPRGFYGYMHGMGFKDNGNLLVFGSFNGTKALIDKKEEETHRDFVLEIDAKKGGVLAKYDLAEMLNPDRSLIVKSANKEFEKIDWAHTNGIDYDAKNKAVIVSGRHFGIVKIDEKTKKPIWWMTPHQFTEKSGRKGDKGDISHLLLTAVDEKGKPYAQGVQKGIQQGLGFKWPLKTHNVKYTGNGVYSILDNSGSMYDKRLYTTKNSVASVFKIDDDKKTVQQLFLKELPAYSEMGSSVIVHPKTKELWVSLGKVQSRNGGRQFNTHIYRFDAKKNLLYTAIIHKGDNSMVYLIQPYEFYAKNNWPTPVE